MALFHLSDTQTKRSAGQSAIASAAYRAGEQLYSEYYGEYSDYTRKGGVICSDILLPPHASPEYADREDVGIPTPHFHVLCPIRPIEQDGKWGLKQRRVYELDEDGNRIRDQNGEFVFNAVPTTDWGSPKTLEYWCQTWAELCNAKFTEKVINDRNIGTWKAGNV